MDHTTYSVRPFVDADYDAVARINTIIQPSHPESAEDSRRWDEVLTRNSGRLVRRLIVEERRTGATVAWGGLGHTLSNYHPRKFFIRAAVEPTHRGRGIGEELYRRLERDAVALNAVCLWGTVREDDPASVRFLERHAFVPLRKTWLSRLSLDDVDLSRLPDRSKNLAEEGIQITTLAAEGVDRLDVRRRLYELACITGSDIPRVGEYAPSTFDEFVELNLVGSRVLPEANFVACRSDEYVGWTSLRRESARSDTLDIAFTGTLPHYRGHGIASELKRRAAAFAHAQGYRYLTTANDSLNPRIWAINQKLGFRREEVALLAEKKLPEPAP